MAPNQEARQRGGDAGPGDVEQSETTHKPNAEKLSRSQHPSKAPRSSRTRSGGSLRRRINSGLARRPAAQAARGGAVPEPPAKAAQARPAIARTASLWRGAPCAGVTAHVTPPSRAKVLIYPNCDGVTYDR